MTSDDPTYRERPTFDPPGSDGQGLQCPACGCRHFLVRNTVRGDRVIIRYRVCRHCGRVSKSIERM